MSSCYLLDSPEDNLDAIYDRYRDVARLSKHAGGIGLSYSRIRSPRLADPRHQRPVQRHRPVAQDARLLGRPRSTRAVAARGRRASTSRRGTPTSRSSSSSRRTPATPPAGPTTSTSPTGSPTCSWSGSRRTGSGRCSTRRRSRTSSTCTATSSAAAYLEAEAAGLYERQVPARELYSRMMRCLAETGNGWMTFKDASNLKSNQTGSVAPTVRPTSSTSPTCAPRSSRSRTRPRPRCATSVRSTSGRWSSTGRRRPARRRLRPPRPRSCSSRCRSSTAWSTSTSTRPTRPGSSNAKWRPVGLGRHGPAGRLLQARHPLRQSDAARTLSARISEEIYFNALLASTRARREARPSRAASTRPERRPVRCSSTSGGSARAIPPVGPVSRPRSPRTACATRC